MLRVTNGMLAGNLTASLGALKERLARLQQQASGGRAFERPSEAPAQYVSAMRATGALQRLDQFQANLSDAQARLANGESALRTINEVIQRARELAVAGANDSLPQDARLNLATEVDKLLESAVQFANSDHGGVFLFGGFVTDAVPFTLDPLTRTVTYNGDLGQTMRDVAPGVQVQINVTGPELRGTTDLFATLRDLADQLRAGTPANISSVSLADLDQVQSSLARLLAETGARSRMVEMFSARSRDVRINLETDLEQIQGADLARTLIDLNVEDTAYRTALAVGSRLLPTSLVDFLR